MVPLQHSWKSVELFICLILIAEIDRELADSDGSSVLLKFSLLEHAKKVH